MEKMELNWTCTQSGEEQGLHGDDGVADSQEKKESVTTEDCMKKGNGKEKQTGLEVQQGKRRQSWIKRES